ncbi:peptidoglycan editing factor PgeF [Pontixanthobacter gangjinensis]|uniref:Purine nucleoside phosphorylase n=1 Tax=Pontixanthobacter gangjinensis TaxID=1028742 RepID=A0A6I4SID9_9SPHN|nr:peptidoglycan editing factor PgeF [Pontixanthobacter gangjinensis]MXO55581.1 peptidoglycan editing factor PgeF [Pontixanthobacter gangjinensis]
MAEVDTIRAESLKGFAHGFLGRRGGISTGAVAGLNVGLGADDDDTSVTENRRRAVEAVMPGAKLATVYQVHSAEALAVKEPWPVDERPKADGMVTNRPGLLLGIVTADCAPILLADASAGVIGAAHAGWRGAHGGVIEATVDAMEALGAKRAAIAGVIGPCIAQASYEVDDGFRANFADEDAQFFGMGKMGHYQFDLEAYAASRLAKAGIGRIEPLGIDTYADGNRFFSYRRATHQVAATYGRQFSLIGIPT